MREGIDNASRAFFLDIIDMHHLHITRNVDFGALYDVFKNRLPDEEWNRLTLNGRVTRELYTAHCTKQFPAVAFQDGDKQFGWLFFDGEAAHLEVLAEYHGRWGILWPAAVEWIFSNKDPIQVDIDIDNEKCLRFMTRSGWPRIRENEKSITYEMSSRTLAPFLRKRIHPA